MPPMLPRHLLVAVALAMLCAGPASAQVFPRPPRDRVIWLQSETAIMPMRSASAPVEDPLHIQCKNKPCPVEIKVTVNPGGNDPTGRTCAFVVPPVVVLNHKKAEVTWTLIEVPSSSGTLYGAKFRDSINAGDGIRIFRGNATLSHFKGRDAKAKTFGWTRDYDTVDDTLIYFYDINIDHSFGDGRCDVPDPIIVNRN